MDNIEKLIGKKVKEAREAMGLSQSALAKNAKTSLTTINRLEKGKQAPHSSTLTEIAKALGLRVTDFYIDSPKKNAEGEGRDALFGSLVAGLATLNESELRTAQKALGDLFPSIVAIAPAKTHRD